jgi:hypothetical protein
MKNTEGLTDSSNKIGLDVSAKKPKYMFKSHHQNPTQIHSLMIANKSFKNLAKFKYLGATVRYQNFFHVDIKSRLILQNACCLSVNDIFVFISAVKKVKIKMYKTIILLVVLYECETWSLTLPFY